MQRTAVEEVALTKCPVFTAQPQHPGRKLQQIHLPRREVPIDPGDHVVLAIGVVVAHLGAPDLVTGSDHWDPG